MNDFENWGGLVYEEPSKKTLTKAQERAEYNAINDYKKSEINARQFLLGSLNEYFKTESERTEDVTKDPQCLEWIKGMEEYTIKYGTDPDKMKEFWSDFDKNYKKEDKEEGEKLKYEALARVAARNLIMDLKEKINNPEINIKGKGKADIKIENNPEAEKIEIEIEPSTLEEDLDGKVSFWINVKFKGREKKLPCHVSYIDIRSNRDKAAEYENRYRNRFKYPDIALEFIKNNYINFNCPDSKQINFKDKRLANLNIQDREDQIEQIEKMMNILEDFYGNDIKREGVAILLPKYKDQTILYTGKANDAVRKNFIANAMNIKKGMETRFLP